MPLMNITGINTAIKRERHRDDGEADFLRAFERGFHRRQAVFDVAHDVFEHDDGVIHHKAHGEC